MKPINIKYPQQKYFNADDDYCQYLEGNATQAMEVYRQNYLTNKGNAEKLLTLLISGLSALFVMMLKNTSENGWGFLESGFLVLMIAWVACSYGLIHYCIKARNVPLAAIAPSKAYVDDPLNKGEKMSFEQSRRFQLYRLDKKIEVLEVITSDVASKLNQIRWWAATAPVVAGVVALIHALAAKCF